MFEYKDYPQLPNKLITELLDSVAHRIDSGFSDKINLAVEEAYGKLIDTNIDGIAKMGMFTNDALTTWIKENITDTFNAVHVQYFSNGTHFFPHVDLLRTRALNYLISSAGAQTVFYKNISNKEIKPNTIISYDSIEPVNTYEIEPFRWHELCVDEIHSVENIQGTRIAITVSFL